jgi:hypothetical protein
MKDTAVFSVVTSEWMPQNGGISFYFSFFLSAFSNF